MPRFRASSLGAIAIVLAFVALLLRRPSWFILLLALGAGLLWSARRRRGDGS